MRVGNGALTPQGETNVITKPIPPHNPVQRIGILFSDAEELRIPALRFLILKLNSLQRAFEYEILPNRMPGSPLAVLTDRTGLIERVPVRDSKVPEFAAKYHEWLEKFRDKLQEEGTKQLIDLAGKIVLGLILLYLSIHGIKVKSEP
jgi:hypothetical protein